MRACDYIAQRLVENGVKNVYGVMGGGAAGLNDGFIKNDNINFICFHHEQGAANAALAESKITNNISVVNVTTGCGGLNCMTTLVSAYQDSNPVIFLSGNVKIHDTTHFVNDEKNINLRKLGLQEFDIINTVKRSCKFAHFIKDEKEIPHILEKAIFLAQSGRKGPCWIDFPGDFQSKQIDISSLDLKNFSYQADITHVTSDQLNEFSELIKNCSRPLAIAGYGLYLSNQQKKFLKYIEKHKIPFVTTFMTKDLTSYDHILNMGCIGIRGNRSANFAMQNSDLLIIFGSSLGLAHIGYDKNKFSTKSKKILVNIDNDDFLKDNVKIDLFINCNLKDFFENEL